MIPKATIAIPLYKSARFFDTIISNIECITETNIEILISDRHCLDDTIDRLAVRFRADPRVRCIKHHDQVDWVAHINSLLVEAKGKFWRFLPHDDISPPGSLEALIDALEMDAGAILAYGPTRAMSMDNIPIPEYHCPYPHPQSAKEGWTLGLVLEMFWNSYFEGAFKGLIRRDLIVEHHLLIRKTRDNILPERCWLFALSLLGRFRFVPNALYVKRFYPGSVHSQWVVNGNHILGVAKTMSRYLFDLVDRGEVCKYGARDLWLNARNLARWIDNPSGNRPKYIPCNMNERDQIRSVILPLKYSRLTGKKRWSFRRLQLGFYLLWLQPVKLIFSNILVNIHC